MSYTLNVIWVIRYGLDSPLYHAVTMVNGLRSQNVKVLFQFCQLLISKVYYKTCKNLSLKIRFTALSCGSASVVYNNAILTGYTRNVTLYSRALYSCESGLYLSSDSPPFRLCTENGTWTNPNFSCQGSLDLSYRLIFLK